MTSIGKPTINTVVDSKEPVIGDLTDGGSTNDPNLTVTVNLAGTGATKGDTVQLYNGSDTTSPLGATYRVTKADLTAGSITLKTGVLSEGMYDITARIADTLGVQSAASDAFTIVEDTTAPTAADILGLYDDMPGEAGYIKKGAVTTDTDLTVVVGLPPDASAGDSVQLYNGTDTSSPLGIPYSLTGANINAHNIILQTGVLTSGPYAITARIIDQAGNVGKRSSAFNVTEAGSSGDPPCFASGSRILTPVGEVPVECLRCGDAVITADGAAVPIKWIGQRRTNIHAHPRPEVVAPVRIQRHAIAEAQPHTDLFVSPDHALFVDGKLIAARQLINGTTIRQEMRHAAVHYFHIELDHHAILFAEGMPAESYLDTGNRSFFANGGEPLVLHPDLTDESDGPTRETGSCAPFAWDETTVRPIWQRLAERAAAMGQPADVPETTNDPDLHLGVGDRTIRPLCTKNGLFTFVLPQGTTEVRLQSRAASPAETRPWLEDRRVLGVCLERIVVRSAGELVTVALDDPRLSQGWLDVEQGDSRMRRWTNGNALLSLPYFQGPLVLEVCACGLDYVVSDRRAAA